MNSDEMSDDLRPEYDLSKLKVRRVGAGRKKLMEMTEDDDLLPEYDFDYSKAKPNRFADAYKKGVTTRIIGGDEDSSDEAIADRETE